MADEDPAQRGRSPLPFYIVILVLVGALILLPVLPHLAEMSRRVQCQRNMKAIASCLKVYSTACPEGSSFIDWATSEGLLADEDTVCPSSGVAASNYIVVPLGNRAPRSDDVIIFEPKSNHGGEGGNIVFADGHATFARAERYDKLEAEVLSRKGGD